MFYFLFPFLLFVFTYFVKTKYKMRFLDAWSSDVIKQKWLLYSIPILVVLAAGGVTLLVQFIYYAI